MKGNTSYEVNIYKRIQHNNPRLFFNTHYPIGNESVILPKFDFSPPSPVREEGRFSADKIGYRYVITTQSIPVYTDYSASPSAEVSVFVSIEGYNEWRQGTASIGNHYREYIYQEQRGESHGWQVARGDFIPAVGIYPDYSNPIWQGVMKKYQMDRP
jgi:hypothetical protein